MFKFRFFWAVIVGFHRQATVLFVVILIAAVCQSLGLAMILPLLDSILNPGGVTKGFQAVVVPILSPFPKEYTVVVIVTFLASVFLLKGIFTLLEIWITSRFVWQVRERWMERILDRYMYGPYAKLIEQKQGVLTNNLVNETLGSAATLTYTLQFFSRLIIFIALYFTLLLNDWEVTLSLSFFTAIGILLFKQVSDAYSRGVGEAVLKLSQDINGLATENVAAFHQIKAFSLEKAICSLFQKKLVQLTQIMVKFQVISNAPSPIIEVVIVMVVSASLIYIQYFAEIGLVAAIPVLGMFTIIGQRLFHLAASLISGRMEIISRLPSLELVHELAFGNRDMEDINSGEKFAGLKEDIELKNVSFSYPNRSPVFKNINMKVPYGKMTAVVGPSGGGKSTLCDLLIGLTIPESGKIIVNGKSLSDYSRASWRSKIGFVSQESFMFNHSIRDNIRVGNPDIVDSEIEKAAIKAYAHEFIKGFPEGYDTIVGDRGAKLSGGQRQRIALARAIIRDPDLFIFDEATSALDTESEQYVQSSIEELGKTKTTIVIAHRLSTIKKADTVYRIENGKVTAE
jgi:ABC-type multidrug transport system fused ATPase/permease subunit